jgi:hypothetical protein
MARLRLGSVVVATVTLAGAAVAVALFVNAATSDATTVAVGGLGGTTATVRTGPPMLVRLAYQTDWLPLAVGGVAVTVTGLAALGYRRAGGLDEAILEEAAMTTGTCLGALVCVRLLPATWGYVPRAVLAGTLAWALVTGGTRLLNRRESSAE